MNNMISVIIPAYNEQESLAALIPQLIAQFQNEDKYEIIVINDGSSDQTAEVVLGFHKKNPSIHLISLSRNFGAQAALSAGYQKARGACVISLDADMQHPVSVIPDMLEKWRQGYDVVYAVRQKSTHLSLFKRTSARLFYCFFKWLTGMKTDMGADFRLMSRKAVDALNQFSEATPFLRGVVARLGFRQCPLYYNEQKRKYGGASRYTLKKMLNLAVTGMVGFSLKPLHFITFLGILMTIGGGITFLMVLGLYFFGDIAITGVNIMLSILTLFSGIQMLVLGILGEYIGNISVTVRNRPLYLINENTLEKD